MPGRHAKKRQRTDTDSRSDVQPLGSVVGHLLDDAEKDEEERRLESVLFGKPFVPSSSSAKDLVVLDEDEEDDGGGQELGNLLDSDLFVIDAPVAATTDVDITLRAIGRDEDSDNVHSDAEEQQLEIPVQHNTSKGKAPAWTDPDDADLKISLSSNKRHRKLRDAAADDLVGGRDYERRLRRQFEKINPTPGWASAARKKLKSKRRRSSSSGTDDDVDEDLFTSTDGILAGKTQGKVPTLSSGTIAIERLRDANISAKAEGTVNAIQFHPSPEVPILLTTSADRRLRLFNVDGHTNPHLQTLHIPELPLTNAVFHPSGTSILLTGPRPFYYTYDLESGASHRSPRGLWGTTFTNQKSSDTNANMETCAFNSTGTILAVASRCGNVHLVDWKSSTSGSQVLGSVKMNSGVKSLWWNNEGQLLSLAEDSEIYVWDVGQRRCLRRWRDDGGYGSRLVTGDRSGKYLATGSSSGIVNIYGCNETGSTGSEKPQPIKIFRNLTTAIATLRFNPDSQLLAVASKTKKDQMRLVHLPSLTAFSNWPTSGTPLGHVSSIDFAPNSRYVAIGNNRGRVLLYHLRDFDL